MNNIIFSGPMIRAILEGRKTQTRRIMKPQPVYDPKLSERVHTFGSEPSGGWVWKPKKGDNTPQWFLWDGWTKFDPRIARDGPYQEGNELWVRETWAIIKSFDHLLPSEIPKGSARWPTVWYAVPETAAASIKNTSAPVGKIRPSIFMPRWASRLTIKLTGVRVERVQDISEADILTEGTPDPFPPLNGWMDNVKWRSSFRTLWDSINTKAGCTWADNPWVWVLNFEKDA